ncbi:transaldolase [Clostridiales bacterium F-3ap]|uniref:Transaldolase n=2 Tax=Anaerotalea alkaliphila TaxID=2662126 RepID=A0A7X5HW84_9FIRM|nr:transaldolase [Anaerotalea alkaliphila]
MTQKTITEYWNDSCSLKELTYALEKGAVGATTNPVIVKSVLESELDNYEERIRELVEEMPHATEDDIAWKLNEEMAITGAKMLRPLFDESKGQKGRISIQTNTKFWRDPQRLLEQTLHFQTLCPNIQVKMPTTKAGIWAYEEATYHGVSINATVSFTVPQAIAVAEAVERGLKRREAEGKDTSEMRPVCTIMVGRVDDWLRQVADKKLIAIDPECYDWAGVAVMKNAYKIFKEKGYRTQLLAAAYRNHYHWSQFMGGDVSLTIPHKYQVRFNNSNVEIKNYMDEPVKAEYLEQLKANFPDFIKAYEPDGMTVEEFDTYGPVNATLMQFSKGYDDLINIIRKFMIIIK